MCEDALELVAQNFARNSVVMVEWVSVRRLAVFAESCHLLRQFLQENSGIYVVFQNRSSLFPFTSLEFTVY
jgi:hypothetical protein